eukprot:scaffold698_cov333-Pavlova_lutheri.AAC.6
MQPPLRWANRGEPPRSKSQGRHRMGRNRKRNNEKKSSTSIQSATSKEKVVTSAVRPRGTCQDRSQELKQPSWGASYLSTCFAPELTRAWIETHDAVH